MSAAVADARTVAHAAHERPRRSGRTWRIPCPAHGGDGWSLALWTAPDGSLGARCHSAGCGYRDILDALRAAGAVIEAPESPYRPPSGATPARTTPHGAKARQRPVQRAARALTLLAASEAIGTAADHPARRWKSGALWRPDVDLPPWARWISADALADVRGPVRPGPTMAGALIVPAAPLAAWLAAVPDWPRSAVTGCQLVNVAPDGSPAADAGGLGKRSYGHMAGAVAAFGVLDAAAGVTLAESAANALALAARFRPAAVVTFGADGLWHPATVEALASIPGDVTVYPDPDRPKRGPDGRLRRAGPDAAEALRLAIERHGGRLRRPVDELRQPLQPGVAANPRRQPGVDEFRRMGGTGHRWHGAWPRPSASGTMVSTIRLTPGLCKGLPVGTEGGAEGPKRPPAARFVRIFPGPRDGPDARC